MSLNRDTDLLLQSGIAAVRSGDKREGARLLAQVVRKEPQSEDAWFWLAAATDQPAEAAACLRRVLAINPNNDRAKQALGMLESGQGGDAFGAATNTPSSEPPPNRSRALNTAELLAPPGLLEQQAPPPPPAFGASAAAPAPPPFGAPAGFTPRNDPYGANPGSDPYGANPMGAAPGVAAPPPPNFSGGSGLRLGQLDPNAPTQPSVAPPGPAIYDPGSDLRASLLTNAPNQNNPTGVPVINSTTPNQPKASRFGNRNKKTAAAPATTVIVNNNTKKRRSLLPLIVLLVAIVIMVVAYLLLGNKTNGSVQQAVVLPADMTSTASAATAVANGTPLAGGTDTSGANGTIIAGTPGTGNTGLNGGTPGIGSTLVAGTAGVGGTGNNGTNGTNGTGGNTGASGTGAAGTSGTGNNGTNGTGGTQVAGTAGAATGGAGNNGAPTPTIVAANPATATAIAGTVIASANGGGAGNAITITPTPSPAGFPTGKAGTSSGGNQAQGNGGTGSDLTPGTLPTGNGSTNPTPTATAAGAIVPTVVGATQGQGTTGAPTPTAPPVSLPTIAPTPTIPTDNGGPSNPSGTVTPVNPLATPTPSSLAPGADVLKYVADSNTNFIYAQYFQSAINEGIIKPYKAGRIRPGVTKINTSPLIVSDAVSIPQPAFIANSILDGLTGDTPVVEIPAGGSSTSKDTSAASSAPTIVISANGSITIIPPPPTPTPTPIGHVNVHQAPDVVAVVPSNEVKRVVLNGINGPSLYYYIGSAGQVEATQLTTSLGQVATVMKTEPTPADAYQLNQIALEYAQDIRIMADDMDRFFQTGQVSYLEDLSNYNDKANADHQRWLDVVNSGFPFKVGS